MGNQNFKIHREIEKIAAASPPDTTYKFEDVWITIRIDRIDEDRTIFNKAQNGGKITIFELKELNYIVNQYMEFRLINRDSNEVILLVEDGYILKL